MSKRLVQLMSRQLTAVQAGRNEAFKGISERGLAATAGYSHAAKSWQLLPSAAGSTFAGAMNGQSGSKVDFGSAACTFLPPRRRQHSTTTPARSTVTPSSPTTALSALASGPHQPLPHLEKTPSPSAAAASRRSFSSAQDAAAPLQASAASAAAPAAAAAAGPVAADFLSRDGEAGGAPVGSPSFWAAYLGKMTGGVDKPGPPVPSAYDLAVTATGATVAIGALAGLSSMLIPTVGLNLLVPSFGASACLLFAAPDVKLAQPRNFVGGQVLSAAVGCGVRLGLGAVGAPLWVVAPVGVAAAIAAMQMTKTLHPPAGGTALIAASVPDIGAFFGGQFIASIALGSAAMQAIAVLFNNLHANKRYPTFWWK